MQFEFATAGQIVFGRGTSDSAPDRIVALGRRVLLVHGRNPDRAEGLRKALEQHDITVICRPCVGEPDLETLEACVATCRDAGVDAVAALGGGSAVDLGKAVAALVPGTRAAIDHLEGVGEGLPLEAAPLPFVAIPTTAGTGAEVTKNAVISVTSHSRKVSLRDSRMFPDIAIVDPALTDGAPRAVTFNSGLDAITQVIEPFLSTRAAPLTDALCRDAIPRGLNALLRLSQQENTGARDEMAWVSLAGGLALANAGLGAVHGLAGVAGGVSGAPHGELCATLLPHVLAVNAAAVPADTAAAARIAEVSGLIAAALGGASQDAPDTLAAWIRNLGVRPLCDLGVPSDALDRIAETAVGASSSKTNPVSLDRADMARVLERAYR